jgi:hypothetical protein
MTLVEPAGSRDDEEFAAFVSDEVLGPIGVDRHRTRRESSNVLGGSQLVS